MKPTAEQLTIINSRLPGTQVTADQVEVLPFMAFDTKLTDRYTQMTMEMMRKIELDSNQGLLAFNALHRAETTLPVGRSVNGKIKSNELQVNMYAVHTRPDGTPFVDGKELVDKYNTGAVYACSLRVYVGFYKCSICGNDIRDWSKCEHIPGRSYSVDEQPKLCIAYMTGRDIQNGVAMDCGATELSAVTAGGVHNAGVLNTAFSKYESGADPAEFKKSAFEDVKTIEASVTLYAKNNQEQEVVKMDKAEVQAMIDEAFKKGQSVEGLAAVVTAENPYKELYESAKADATKALEASAALKAEFEKANEELSKLKEEYATLEATVTDAKKVAEEAEAFKTAYVATIEALGTALGKSAEYSSMSAKDLQALHEEYKNELNALPHGRQSVDETSEIDTSYNLIPADCFKA